MATNSDLANETVARPSLGHTQTFRANKMRQLPTLRRELITALALVFVGALLAVATGVIVIFPQLKTPAQGALYLTLLLAGDVTVFAIFGRYLVQQRLLGPLDRMIEGAEAIAQGGYEHR